MGYCLLKASNEIVVKLMTKWILGGALLTLGIIKLADMVQEQPSVGIPLAIVITILWIIQMEKDYRGARK